MSLQMTPGCCNCVIGRSLTVLVLIAGVAAAVAFLGSPFSVSPAADVPANATAVSMLPAPQVQAPSAPVANTKPEDQGETVLDNWTYTNNHISRSH